jgi:DNA-binding response OmpR family regulator
MVKDMRSYDSQLVNILREELQEYMPIVASDKNLENVLCRVIEYIRNNSRGSESIIKVDEYSYWDKKREGFYYKNEEVLLTNKEKIVLALLFKNLQHVTSYNNISYTLWGDATADHRARIKTIVKQLRKKLPKNIITNVSSLGYILERKKLLLHSSIN